MALRSSKVSLRSSSLNCNNSRLFTSCKIRNLCTEGKASGALSSFGSKVHFPISCGFSFL